MKWLLKLAFIIDTLRLFPRLFCTAYLVGGGFVLNVWLTTHTTWTQDGFASIYAALCIPMLKWYMENGTDYSRFYPMLLRGYKPTPPVAATPPAAS